MSRSRRDLLAWLILAATVAAVLVLFWPGRVTIDTLNQIDEAATGEFTDRSTPILLALWHVFWGIGFGPEAVLVAQVVTFVIGAYLILRAAFSPTPAAAITAAVVFWPAVLGNLASLQRDTWITALTLLTFGIVVRATQRDWPARGYYLALAVAAAWFALASRQNAAPLLVIACIAIVALLLARRRERSEDGERRASRPWAAAAASVAGGVALTVGLMGTQWGAAKLLDREKVHPDAPLYVYDLAAISQRERENLFPAELMPRRTMEPIDRTYDPDSMLGFLLPTENWPPIVQFATGVEFPNVRDEAARSLRSAWKNAIADHPLTYLEARWELWLRQIGLGRSAVSVYPPVADGNGAWPFAFPALYGEATDYLEAFTHPDPDFFGHPTGGVLFRVWIYLLAALAAAIVLLRPGRSPPLLVIGAMALAALTYQVGWLFVALGTRFRYELPSLVIAMLAAAILAHFAWGWWRQRSPNSRREALDERRGPGGARVRPGPGG